jgi:MFS family permease
VIAPLAGGLITTYASWQWMFVINVPLGAVAFVVAWRLIDATATESPPPLDRLGVLLTCTGLGGVTYAGELLTRASPNWGLVIVLVIVSTALLVAAARHLLRAKAPLVNLYTLRIPTFGAAIAGSSMFWLVVGAIPFLLPLLFQTVFHWTPIKSGALVLFVFVGNIAIKPATTWLFNRFGFRTVLLGATGGLAGLGVAAATIALRAGDLLPGHASQRTVYALAFALLAAVALASLVDALRLHPSAGEALVDDPGSRRGRVPPTRGPIRRTVAQGASACRDRAAGLASQGRGAPRGRRPGRRRT